MEQSPQGFASEDEEATYCLSLLRDGDRTQQIVARERLSHIFERRGLLDETAQCLESNIREGVRDPRVYQRLAGVYRRQGRHELADEVLVEARRLAERLARPPGPGGRRPGPVRPGRPAPPPTVPVPAQPRPQDVPTAQLPAAPATARRMPPPPAPELEMDRIGAALGAPRPPAALDDGQERAARPWWLSPAMVVLLVLLCGPYGLALMWVRGGYSQQARIRVTAIWGALVVLTLAAASVLLQTQVASIVAGTSGLAPISPIGAAPTPIVFPPAPAPAAKPTLPAGLAPSPPAISASPGALPAGPSSTIISPAVTAEPKPEASPPAATTKPSAPADAPERVKVRESDGTGANLRERPGQTGTVVKTIPEGAVLEVIGPDRSMDGKGWRNVRDDAGAQGWMAAELLEPAP